MVVSKTYWLTLACCFMCQGIDETSLWLSVKLEGCLAAIHLMSPQVLKLTYGTLSCLDCSITTAAKVSFIFNVSLFLVTLGQEIL